MPVAEIVAPVVETDVAEDGTTDQDLLDGAGETTEQPVKTEVSATAETNETQEPVVSAETDELVDAPMVEDPPVVEEPKFVQITEKQLADLQLVAQEVAGLKDALHRGVSGMGSKVGTIEAALKKVTDGAAGKNIKFTREHFTELSKDFPDIVDMIVSGTNRGFEGASAAPVIDVDAKVSERFNAALPTIIETVEKRTSMAVMDGLRPGWLAEVQSPAYRGWLESQPKDYFEKVENSWGVDDVYGSLKKFDEFTKQSTKPKAVTPVIPARPSRFAAAVTPRSAGGGGGRSAPNTEEAAMQEGYKSRR
ncbi:MAG: hypothetical protein ABIU97_01780 [Dehalococcoidia bacterium]